MIPYTDYLLRSGTELTLSTSTIISPRSIGSPIDLDFKFIVRYDPVDVEKQCETFLYLIRSNPFLNSTIEKYISLPFNERDDAIKGMLKYSLFKTLSSMKDLIDSGYNYVGAIPANSAVFYGHKKLFYTFLNHNVFNNALNLSATFYLTKILTVNVSIFY